ncbi:MAG: biotin--[acetyl-CoA-carboxylase] ligase [Balneolaceae bacterium]|nr:biotin--[acetyl-CoA-carboxylase] ligase [Balneolaceae bacterium]
MFDAERFEKLLETRWLGHGGHFFEELPSTNSYMKEQPASGITHGMLCLADHQTRGRGQYERSWETEAGCNLTFTLCFRPPRVDRLHVLTLTCALALLREMEKELGEGEVTLKWPNDVLVGERKAAGLLTETVFNGNRLDRVLVGIGLNVNQERFPGELGETATSMRRVKGDEIDREALLARLLSRLEYEYGRWNRNKTDLLREINRSLRGYGQWVRLQVNGERWDDTYKFLGVSEAGRLLVVDHDGGLKSFSYEQIRLVPA